MNLVFSEHAWEDYRHWQKTDKKTLKRINALIQAIQRSPREGMGKPEALKHGLPGYWSRRLDSEHRIVYKVDEDNVYIVQLRYHY